MASATTKSRTPTRTTWRPVPRCCWARCWRRQGSPAHERRPCSPAPAGIERRRCRPLLLRAGGLRVLRCLLQADAAVLPGALRQPDALPVGDLHRLRHAAAPRRPAHLAGAAEKADRKSTRLNSSHLVISYAVFCLKKKKNL